MIYTEIKNENALRSNIKKLFEEYGGISRGSSSDSQLKECTEMALQIMTKKTVSGKWYMISATDEDLSALSRYRDVLVDAYGLLGRGLVCKEDALSKPGFTKKAKVADIYSTDHLLKARSYLLIWGYYTEKERQAARADLFVDLVNASRRRLTHEQRGNHLGLMH